MIIQLSIKKLIKISFFNICSTIFFALDFSIFFTEIIQLKAAKNDT